jgi:hypothetical protein
MVCTHVPWYVCTQYGTVRREYSRIERARLKRHPSRQSVKPYPVQRRALCVRVSVYADRRVRLYAVRFAAVYEGDSYGFTVHGKAVAVSVRAVCGVRSVRRADGAELGRAYSIEL